MENLNELALFAGAGGGILGGTLLGWRTVCAVEWEPYPASVLCARQNDGLLPHFPIWDDVQTFDGFAWRGLVDVVSGGFPCQDISGAGKGAGIDGEKSGMWREMARIIYEVRPRYVFVENSPMLTSRGLGTVLGDLASMGFDAKWGVLGAADIGANHQRDRIWIVGEKLAHPLCNGLQGSGEDGGFERQAGLCGGEGSNKEQDLHMAHPKNKGYVRWFGSMATTESKHDNRGSQTDGGREWWEVEPNVGRVANGLASRVDRLKAVGNGQVPLCAATAWRLLK
jgi:DNA (cytosine-5)-methyltransferase 1